MPTITMRLTNDKEWILTNCELVIPNGSTEDLTEEEIGALVMTSLSVLEEFQSYLSVRHTIDSFSSVDEFRKVAQDNYDNIAAKQVRHSAGGDVWQINYEPFSAAEFRDILAEDNRLKLISLPVRKTIEVLIETLGAWQEIANELGISEATAQDRIRLAVSEYKKRKSDRSYQPKRLQREKASDG